MLTLCTCPHAQASRPGFFRDVVQRAIRSSPHGFVGCDLRDASNNLTHEWAVSGYHLKVCAALWGAGLGCRLL